MDRLVGRALEPLRLPAERKGLIFRTELPSAVLTGDLSWLGEAVGNLAKNSVEHTPPGGEIAVRCVDNPLYILLEIRDSGPGIPEEDLPHIFERFYRGKNAAADSVGIGLALSKSIVARHGGSLEAQSHPGKGTCFRMKFYKTIV